MSSTSPSLPDHHHLLHNVTWELVMRETELWGNSMLKIYIYIHNPDISNSSGEAVKHSYLPRIHHSSCFLIETKATALVVAAALALAWALAAAAAAACGRPVHSERSTSAESDCRDWSCWQNRFTVSEQSCDHTDLLITSTVSVKSIHHNEEMKPTLILLISAGCADSGETSSLLLWFPLPSSPCSPLHLLHRTQFVVFRQRAAQPYWSLC